MYRFLGVLHTCIVLRHFAYAFSRPPNAQQGVAIVPSA